MYVERHPDEADRTRLVVNLDSVAAITGRNQLMVVGPEGLVGVRRMTTPGYQRLRGRSRRRPERAEGGAGLIDAGRHAQAGGGPGATRG